ncbi:adenylylsulfate kinase [Microbacterium testaceum]|uniref:Adenylylsulfate kinase n=1 Tax=Microbacterium testaceum TaxID=2033 RepID=A0A147EZE0_MICTE|nr:adenylyl-sulfate kinase [Microbacterium testaceum]KTR95825.1 adenylylsulfate kinase [Microbacterium testaceum]
MISTPPTEVIFIGGRSGVGKSTVASEASRILAAHGIWHAVIEGDNLDQAYPEPWRDGIALAEHNLAAMWSAYRVLGYHRLLFTNTVSITQVAVLSAALGGEVRARSVLLTSTDATAADRLSRREWGTSLDEHIARSGRAAAQLDAHTVDVRIATDGRTPDKIARDMLGAAGWLAAIDDRK